MPITKKKFLDQCGAFTLGFEGYRMLNQRLAGGRVNPGLAEDLLGPLQPDPNGIFDLPDGFSYTIISRAGYTLNDGFLTPGKPVGMAAFPGKNGRTILIRNHKMDPDPSGGGSAFGSDYSRAVTADSLKLYDAGMNENPAQGGTTTLVFDTTTQTVHNEYLSLGGTLRNCAGGPTPWNTWLTCEEIVSRADDRYSKDHGYVFEVPASEDTHLFKAEPIKSMGRFNHEAMAVDPRSNVIYLTEDDSQGLLYRFIPNTPGQLLDGGKLQALVVYDQPKLDTRNWNRQTVQPNEAMPVKWMDLHGIDEDDLRFRGHAGGAARFARGEGMWYGNNAVYFACTNGGSDKKGQIWKYVPSTFEGSNMERSQPGTLELFVEPNNGNIIKKADNLTVAPGGDLVVCEDGGGDNYLLGITQSGNVYRIGCITMKDSKLTGATFSPDGSTLFMNIQQDGLTLAITGPWRS